MGGEQRTYEERLEDEEPRSYDEQPSYNEQTQYGGQQAGAYDLDVQDYARERNASYEADSDADSSWKDVREADRQPANQDYQENADDAYVSEEQASREYSRRDAAENEYSDRPTQEDRYGRADQDSKWY